MDDSPGADVVWKGENENDSEYVLSMDSFPLDDAGTWSEKEVYSLYKQKLEKLRTLYMGQLTRLNYVLHDRRRRFLHDWQAAGGTRDKASAPSEGSDKHVVAYRCYRKRMSEEGLLERKQKLRRVTATLDLYTKKELRESNKSHYQHLMKLQQQLRASHTNVCSTFGCTAISMPYTAKCSKHILEDTKQVLYTCCSYSHTNGVLCTNPVPKYLEPSLCGAHWDQIEVNLSDTDNTDSDHEEFEKNTINN